MPDLKSIYKRMLPTRLRDVVAIVGVVVAWSMEMEGAVGIRFVMDREECLSHEIDYAGDTLHVSFVVIKSDTPWHFTLEGIDLRVKGPSGEEIREMKDKTSEKFEFMVRKAGVYRFCFTNRSPYHETIDFDLHITHFASTEQHAKGEHFGSLMEQIAKLEEALYNIQFEQHWLQAQNERQTIVHHSMSKRAIQKAMFESAALVGTSALQIYLMQRLFERKLKLTRV